MTWEPSFCIHAGECIRGAPDVFDFARRPWVVVDNDTADRIAETVRRCPTGALHYRRLDGAEQEPVPADLVAWAVPKRAAAAARPDQDRRSERRADPRGHPGDVVQVWGVREQAVL